MEFISNGHLIEYSLPRIAVNISLKKGSLGNLPTTTANKAGSKEENLHLFSCCSYGNNILDLKVLKDYEVKIIPSQLTRTCDIGR